MLSRVIFLAWFPLCRLGLGLACSVPVWAVGPSQGGAIRGPSIPNPVLGTAGIGSLVSEDPGSWSQWWVLNRDVYLRRGEVLYGGQVNQGSPDTRGGFAAGVRDWDEDLRTRVIPEFLRILSRERDTELVASTAIALAKVGAELAPAEIGSEGVGEALQVLLNSGNQQVRECAVLAQGILGTRSTAPLLTEILEGKSQGSGAKPITRRMRALAAYGLGAIGRRTSAGAVRAYCVHHLAAALATGETTNADIGIACVISLGLVRLRVGEGEPLDGVLSASGSRQGQFEFLLGQLGRSDLSQLVRSYIPRALARLAGDVPHLREHLVSSLAARLEPAVKEDSTVRLACVLALGRLGNSDQGAHDAQARMWLTEIAKSGQVQEQGFALIALGQIGGRGGDDLHGKVPGELRTTLLGRVKKGGRVERPWAALALGLLEWGRTGAGEQAAPESLSGLRKALTESKNPDRAGALCVALGLAGDGDAIELLIQRASRGDEAIRGQAITALGMLGALEALPLLRRLAMDGRNPGLAREAAIALALMRDREGRLALIPDAKYESAQSHQISALLSLAYAGDALVVGDLSDILLSRRNSETVRAYAAVALGIVADKDLVPWNHPIAADVNWWQGPSLLFDPLTGRGVVDLF